MRLDEKLNLVLPVRESPDGKPFSFAVHTPISREVFEISFRILSLTKAALFSKGLPFAFGTGPGIARLTLLDEAKRDEAERGEGAVLQAKAILQELKRLTMIVGPGPSGYSAIPVDSALGSGLMDKEEWEEAESALLFFTLAFSLVKMKDRKMVMESTASILGGSLTSQTPSEFAVSCQTSTTEGSRKGEASSVPL